MSELAVYVVGDFTKRSQARSNRKLIMQMRKKCQSAMGIVSAAIILVVWLLVPAGIRAESWQYVSANAFTNAQIVWQIPSNALPKTLWVYHRILPHVFPADVLSNAVVLASLQSRGFPSSTTNDFRILQQEPENWPGPISILFEIRPADACLYYLPGGGPVSQKEIPNDEVIIRTARRTARLLGLDQSELKQDKIFTRWMDEDQDTHNILGRGVFFPRQLDGIRFFSMSDSGDATEGFSMEFGERGQIRGFSVRWSDLERDRNQRVATEDEITRCIRAHKAIIVPNFKPDDFAWLKTLAGAKKLTILKVIPYYGEGAFGEIPTNDAPYAYATPFAELEAVADVGDTRVPVKLLSPILSAEISRLTKTK